MPANRTRHCQPPLRPFRPPAQLVNCDHSKVLRSFQVPCSRHIASPTMRIRFAFHAVYYCACVGSWVRRRRLSGRATSQRRKHPSLAIWTSISHFMGDIRGTQPFQDRGTRSLLRKIKSIKLVLKSLDPPRSGRHVEHIMRRLNYVRSYSYDLLKVLKVEEAK